MYSNIYAKLFFDKMYLIKKPIVVETLSMLISKYVWAI